MVDIPKYDFFMKKLSWTVSSFALFIEPDRIFGEKPKDFLIPIKSKSGLELLWRESW